MSSPSVSLPGYVHMPYAGESVESFVSNVSIRLQLLSQDLNSELEKGESPLAMFTMIPCSDQSFAPVAPEMLNVI